MRGMAGEVDTNADVSHIDRYWVPYGGARRQPVHYLTAMTARAPAAASSETIRSRVAHATVVSLR